MFLHQIYTQSKKNSKSQSPDTSEERKRKTINKNIQVIFLHLKNILIENFFPDINLSSFIRLIRDNHFKVNKNRRNIVTSHFWHQWIKPNGSLQIFPYLRSNTPIIQTSFFFIFSLALQNRVRIDLSTAYIQPDPGWSITTYSQCNVIPLNGF